MRMISWVYDLDNSNILSKRSMLQNGRSDNKNVYFYKLQLIILITDIFVYDLLYFVCIKSVLKVF